MSLFTININIEADVSGINEKLDNISNNITNIMATIAELNAKADALQAALDLEQEQIAAAIAGLNTAITDLQAIVAAGGTEAERQALADKLDAIKTDLEGTVADTPPTP